MTSGLTSSFFIILVGLSSVALSIPTAPQNTTTNDLEKRQCVSQGNTQQWACDERLPTLAEITARIRDTTDAGLADAGRVAVFWTNLDDPNLRTSSTEAAIGSWVAGWLNSRSIRYYWWFQHMNFYWRSTQLQWISDNAAKYQDRWGDNPIKTFDMCSYQALSAAAIAPDAYLFTKKYTAWGANSAWEQAEYWQLTQNPNIKRIWRVDPRPWHVAGISALEMCSHIQEELMWDRDRGDPQLEARFDCPVNDDGRLRTDGDDGS